MSPERGRWFLAGSASVKVDLHRSYTDPPVWTFMDVKDTNEFADDSEDIRHQIIKHF